MKRFIAALLGMLAIITLPLWFIEPIWGPTAPDYVVLPTEIVLLVATFGYGYWVLEGSAPHIKRRKRTNSEDDRLREIYREFPEFHPDYYRNQIQKAVEEEERKKNPPKKREYDSFGFELRPIQDDLVRLRREGATAKCAEYLLHQDEMLRQVGASMSIPPVQAGMIRPCPARSDGWHSWDVVKRWGTYEGIGHCRACGLTQRLVTDGY